jgi:hypothetical protein
METSRDKTSLQDPFKIFFCRGAGSLSTSSRGVNATSKSAVEISAKAGTNM